MTAATETRTARHGDTLAGAHVSFPRVLRSEWIKLTTLRSTPWTIATTIVLMVLISLGMAWGITQGAEAAASGDAPPELAELGESMGAVAASVGYSFGQIVVVVLGVLIISGEYATGQIKSTLGAVPHRWPVLVAKGILVAAVSFITGAIGVAISYLVTTPMLEEYDIAADLSNGEHVRIMLGAPLYLAAIALLALGVGALLRHAAAGISTVVGLILLLPIITSFITLDWLADLAPYFPSTAGERIMGADTGQEVLTPWEGFGVLGIYIALIWVVALVLLRRRDA